MVITGRPTHPTSSFWGLGKNERRFIQWWKDENRKNWTGNVCKCQNHAQPTIIGTSWTLQTCGHSCSVVIVNVKGAGALACSVLSDLLAAEEKIPRVATVTISKHQFTPTVAFTFFCCTEEGLATPGERTLRLRRR